MPVASPSSVSAEAETLLEVVSNLLPGVTVVPASRSSVAIVTFRPVVLEMVPVYPLATLVMVMLGEVVVSVSPNERLPDPVISAKV